MARQDDDQHTDDGLDPEVVTQDQDQADAQDAADDGDGEPAAAAPKPVVTQKPDGGVQVRTPPARQNGSPGRPSKWVSRREVDEMRANFERQIQALQRGPTPGAPAAPAKPAASPAEQEMGQISQRMNQLMAASVAEMDPAARQALNQEFNALAQQHEKLRTEALEQRLLEKLRGEIQKSVPDSHVQAQQAIIVREFPDLATHPRAARIAQSYLDAEVQSGRPETLELLREAAAYAYRAEGLGQRPRSRMGAGATNGAAGGARGSGGGGQTFDFPPELRTVMENHGLKPEDVVDYHLKNGGQ